MINQGMIDQGAQALAERIGKLDADLFRGAAEAVLRAALSDKPSPGDRTRTGETARGEACDLAPPPSTHVVGTLDALRRAERFMSGFEGDEMQEGIDADLAAIREAIEQAEAS